MAKRETAEQRSVTFTKRRQGLFNKAADLCRICDAQIAIMVSSTGSKEKGLLDVGSAPYLFCVFFFLYFFFLQFLFSPLLCFCFCVLPLLL
ncbi:hypothetical protein NC653_017805 [Populus alba x Populus x berolinensis]|uniref:MADS-box domain-containing protein n=1 Tax=Populus alba x Populus x berolinensis TaxID=444605 RepID=A0AAD6W140_9ROSI|nr:hypothetical protein NC653_017805 [Populus alba x Populus x berolinensis]